MTCLGPRRLRELRGEKKKKESKERGGLYPNIFTYQSLWDMEKLLGQTWEIRDKIQGLVPGDPET